MAEIQQGCSKCCISLGSGALRDENRGAISQICVGQEPEGQEHIPHPPHHPFHKCKTSNAQRSRSLEKLPLVCISLSPGFYAALSTTAGKIHGTAIKLKIPARKTILNSSSDVLLLNKKSRRNHSASQSDFQERRGSSSPSHSQ